MIKWVALVALFWALPASAKNWYLVAISDTNTTAYFIDRDSIVNSGPNMRRIHAWSVHSADDDDGTASRELVLEFDCTGARYRFLHLTGYNSRLTVLSDEAGSGMWRDVTSGSLDDSARQFVCSGGTRPSSAKSYGAGNPFAAGRRAMGVGNSSGSKYNSHGG
ncbi:MAG: hypothetical protein E7773_07140 [Sphingomonas sp.]|uniref:surface-adhesin E family protein n=1 Tax=Sphingomonas sp. TaxID=28214 RepID=UPI001225B8BD|nr:surface-adhesin E family protein [Sphingomonas sp.]THD36767.1 MAG: hypothetical protein E7773_07140 [Sphingomonas sp.]